jgi:hypothetical protein
MLLNFTIGFGLIALTALVHVFGLIWITRGMDRIVARFRWHGGSVLAMLMVVAGLFLLLLLQASMWAVCYDILDAFPDFGTSLYFSIATFSTLGLGDVVPMQGWRILAALESLGGFLFIGWSTAYLVSASMRLGPFRSGEHF